MNYPLLDWLKTNPALMVSLAGLSFLAFVGTLAAIPVLVVRMPADYFLRHKPPPDSWAGRHRALRLALLIAKNAVGVLLVLVGIVLAVPLIPGQGILTILVGISLLNFPGKRGFELKLARQRPVRRAIEWMRARADRPPLELPDE